MLLEQFYFCPRLVLETRLLLEVLRYALREVGHCLSLEHVLSDLHKKTFINRMIFTDCC